MTREIIDRENIKNQTLSFLSAFSETMSVPQTEELEEIKNPAQVGLDEKPNTDQSNLENIPEVLVSDPDLFLSILFVVLNKYTAKELEEDSFKPIELTYELYEQVKPFVQ